MGSDGHFLIKAFETVSPASSLPFMLASKIAMSGAAVLCLMCWQAVSANLNVRTWFVRTSPVPSSKSADSRMGVNLSIQWN